MNLIMSYVDHNFANIDEREKFIFNSQEVCQIYEYMKERADILGGVIIGTCNRTELYLSLDNDTDIDPFTILCNQKGFDEAEFSHLKRTLRGHDAIRHLMLVSAGTESQIWGDAQIIGQVRESIVCAREHKAVDSILNVLFRTAVSAGKRVKTLVDFKLNDNSTAAKAVGILNKRDDVENVLIIGNGMIGRLVGDELIRNGYSATMTLRQFKSGAISVPRKVNTVNYGERYKVLGDFDAVVSATLSPHHTLSYDELAQLDKIPKVFIDLAVPRDIDPKIENIDGISYYDIDLISKDETDESKDQQMYEIGEILRDFEDDFYRWYDFKLSIGRRAGN